MSSDKNQLSQFLAISRVVQLVLQKQNEFFSKEILKQMQSTLSDEGQFSDAKVIAEVLYLVELVLDEAVGGFYVGLPRMG